MAKEDGVLTGPEIVALAWADFDAWLAEQSEEIQAMPTDEQADHYARMKERNRTHG